MGRRCNGEELMQKRVVILGGGTAGWIVAARLAAEGLAVNGQPVSVTLIESADVPTIGVGEGTWPSMRTTLERIGISEQEFLSVCQASFKQGSRFTNWRSGTGESYDHRSEERRVGKECIYRRTRE